MGYCECIGCRLGRKRNGCFSVCLYLTVSYNELLAVVVVVRLTPVGEQQNRYRALPTVGGLETCGARQEEAQSGARYRCYAPRNRTEKTGREL